MNITKLKIPDVLLLTPKIFSDHRGRFMETFRNKDLTEVTGTRLNFIQGNVSYSMPWTIRGLHYQDPHPQGKLIRVIHGKIQDVAVDLRAGSATYGKYVSHILDDMKCEALWVPPGFAHGFMTFDNGASVYYECSGGYYADEWAHDLRWDDSDIGVVWALPPGRNPLISNKDRAAPPLSSVTPITL